MSNQIKLFRLVSSPNRGFWTGTTQEGQVLLGIQYPVVSIVNFAIDGSVRSYSRRDLPAEVRDRPDWYTSLDARLAINRQIKSLKREIGYVRAPIHLQPFQIKVIGVGLEETPAEFHKILSNPEAYPEIDYKQIADDLVNWVKKGQFVLIFNKDYWINRRGKVIAS